MHPLASTLWPPTCAGDSFLRSVFEQLCASSSVPSISDSVFILWHFAVFPVFSYVFACILLKCKSKKLFWFFFSNFRDLR